MQTLRLTAAQALVRFLVNQYLESDGLEEPVFSGVFAIFGHGNVAGLGEALYEAQAQLPTYRAHNEQGMAHTAIAYAKANNRRKMMACTSSIGPGATNMVTAAALAHANRLPVLFIPGDTYATRTPDPVLQQIEDFSDLNKTVNDCFKPVSRYFDRICRPEQLIHSLPIAMRILLDPENCGPVTLAFPQDVQAEAFDFPVSLFAKKVWRIRRQPVDEHELEQVISVLKQSRRPMIIAGGGVHYSQACGMLAAFAHKYNIPVAETQAGKGALNWRHECAVGGIGVTGSMAANQLINEADVVIAIGSRLQDFTTQSRTLFEDKKVIQLNVGGFDAAKHGALPLQGDAKTALERLNLELKGWLPEKDWLARSQSLNGTWQKVYSEVTRDTGLKLPTDAQVLGAIKRRSLETDVIVCAAGGLPGELHKLWRAEGPGTFHVEYGFSCMGYEIAGGLGVKMACPDREVLVVVGDGSYMMLNSELATSVMMNQKIILIVLDNRGFGCINRLQLATGNKPFNNLLENCHGDASAAPLDFAKHATALGAEAEKVNDINQLEDALMRARDAKTSFVIVIDTDPQNSTDNQTWWDVAIPQVSNQEGVNQAYATYLKNKDVQPY